MSMRTKQNETSLLFLIIISNFGYQDGVHFMVKTNVEVNTTSYTRIQRIEEEYMKDESERKKKVPVDTSLVVHVDSIGNDTTKLTQVDETLGISSPSPFVVLDTTSSSHYPLTMAMVHKMGNLVCSSNVRALRVEATVLSMISQVKHATLSPIKEEFRWYDEGIMIQKVALDALTTRVDEYETKTLDLQIGKP